MQESSQDAMDHEVVLQRQIRLLRGLVIAVEVLVVVFVICAGLLTFWSWNTMSRRTTVITVSQPTANAEADVDRWLPVDGEVILTLTLPKSEIVPSGSASRKAKELARTTLAAIPTASSVAVFDGNSSLIARYRR